MKGMKGMKLSLMFVSLLTALLIMTGCDTSSKLPRSIQTTEGTSVQQPVSPKGEIKFDSGRYNGQIDSNSIEIKLSGVPEGIEPQAFRLSESIKETFDTYQFKTGDTLKFSYSVNEHGQNIISELTILSRVSNNS